MFGSESLVREENKRGKSTDRPEGSYFIKEAFM